MLSSIIDLFKTRDPIQDLNGLKTILKMYQKDELEIDADLLKMLCTVTKYHYNDRKILLLACHIMSNIALDEAHAVSMVERGAASILCKVLKKNDGDCRIVWKATSALWNLCRPHNIGQHIPDYCPALVFNCLLRNSSSSRATHTCLGALSNLALVCPEAFKKCMTRENLQQLLEIIRRYKFASEICGHFGALVANMSVCAELATQCVDLGFIKLLVHCLQTADSEGEEAIKHLVAALHNLSDITEFTPRLCLCQGVETLRKIQSDFDGEIPEFVAGIFELGGLPDCCTTSLQVAAISCDVTIVADLLVTADIEEKTFDDKSACDLALENSCEEVVELLLGAGAILNTEVFESLAEEKKHKLSEFVQRGNNLRIKSKNKMQTLVSGTAKMVCDVSQVVTEFIPGVEVLLVLQ